MRIVSKLSLSLVALTLMLVMAPKSFAADAAAGSIAGTVTGVDGKPSANVAVKLMAPPAAKPAPKSALNLADKPAKGKGAPALKETTTNDKGEFTFADVAAGDYVVAAGGKDAGGMGREKVTVKAGEKATVSITLKAPKAK